jgi:hypothetical protein
LGEAQARPLEEKAHGRGVYDEARQDLEDALWIVLIALASVPSMGAGPMRSERLRKLDEQADDVSQGGSISLPLRREGHEKTTQTLVA